MLPRALAEDAELLSAANDQIASRCMTVGEALRQIGAGLVPILGTQSSPQFDD